MTRCSQCGWDFTFVQDYRAHYCQQAAAKQTTPQSPKEALPGKFPPRGTVTFYGDSCRQPEFNCYTWPKVCADIKYISEAEHESALAEAVRKAREKGKAEAYIEVYEECLRALPESFAFENHRAQFKRAIEHWKCAAALSAPGEGVKP